MKGWLDEQIAGGGYGTVSEYFRQLIRQEQKRRLQEEIDARLLAALESGDPVPVTAEFWEGRRKELEKRIKKNTKQS